MKLIKIPAIVLMILSASVLLCSCGTDAIDLRDYVSVAFRGANGYGSIDADFDEDALAEDLMNKYGKKIEKAANGSEIYEDDPDLYAEMIAELFYLDADADNLSNKDKVTVEIGFDGSLEKIEKKTGIRFEHFECEYTVSGLGDVEELDVFENMEMKISGISPELSVSFSEKETGKYGFYVKYSLAANAPFRYKIGDTVNVKASFSSGADLEHGYVVKNTEKSIVITPDMATQYITNAEDCDAQIISYMKEIADKNAAKQYTVEDSRTTLYNNHLELNEAESIGPKELHAVWLCHSDTPTLKTPTYATAKNFVCFVYKFRVNNANYTGIWNSPIQSYDGDAYAYIYFGNVTRSGENINYSIDEAGFSTTFFTSVEDLQTYLTSHNYTISEVDDF